MVGCGATGSGPFGESRGEVYADCSSMWSSKEELVVYTWWRTDLAGEDCEKRGGEACAAQTLVESYRACTRGRVKLVTKPSKNETLQELEANHGNPDGGIVNGNADVCRLVGDDVNNPRLANLGTPDDPVLPFLRERTPEALRNLVTCGGYQFGALLGLHRINRLFYNRTIVEHADVNAALTERGIRLASAPSLELDDLTAMFEVLRGFGYERPLLLSDDSTTWSRFLVENLMVAIAETARVQSNNPVDAYTAFWSELSRDTHQGGHYINMVPFDAALRRFEQLSPYIQYVAPGNESVLATLRERAPSAVFTLTGDWEEPHMPAELSVRPFPGTDRAYVYTADVAVVMPTSQPLTEEHPMASWLKVITSEQAQTEYQRNKHSLDFLTFEKGHSKSKGADELFTVDGTELRGYQGLPAYVPFLTFAQLGSSIQRYMTCLVNSTAEDAGVKDESGGTAVDVCAPVRDELRQYVHDQYCAVISGSYDGCPRHPPPWTQAQ